MKRSLVFLALLALLTPRLVLATEGADIAISSRDIDFSSDTLIAGQTIRLYATLENKGTVDISGYVAFFQGDISVGTSQVVTLVSGGLDEEVWVDFTVPYSSFNIRAEVRGTDPQDVNVANDLALTALFTPVIDDDGDGVVDGDDNCPDNKNSSQTDTDGDGLGDACDDDDDDDTLSDDVESELGTDTTKKDTDSDGTNDQADAYPLDSARTQKEVAAPAVASAAPASSSTSTTSTAAANSEQSTPASNAEAEIEESVEATIIDAQARFKTSPKAAFEYTRLDWKTYGFRVLAVSESARSISWDFGDQVTSAQSEVEHTYRSAGKYLVTLTVEDDEGNLLTDSQEIEISYFHLANPVVKIIVGILLILLISSLAMVLRRNQQANTAEKNPDSIEKKKALKKKKA